MNENVLPVTVDVKPKVTNGQRVKSKVVVVESPQLLTNRSVIVYVPDAVYTWLGVAVEAVPPSPNCQ